MTNNFAEALAPFPRTSQRTVRDIEILRVSAQLCGDSFEHQLSDARRAALVWAQRRAGGELPVAAWEFKDFELPAGGRNSSAVSITNENLDLRALRSEDPDKNVPGRVWTTEIVIGGARAQRPHFSLRLVVSTTESELGIDHHVPGPVLQAIAKPGLIRGARELLSRPITLQNANDAEDLCDHLEDAERRLPVFVVTLPADNAVAPLVDDALLAKATAGIARTIRVPAELTWVLTKRFGTQRSVFNGGVRAYLRGFTTSDDPYRHRLFLGSDLQDEKWSLTCVRRLRALAADASVTDTRLGKDVLDFASIRTASWQLKKSDLSERVAPEAERLKTLEDLAESLDKQVEEKIQRLIAT